MRERAVAGLTSLAARCDGGLNAAVRQAARVLRGALAVFTATAIVVRRAQTALRDALRRLAIPLVCVAYSLGDGHQPAPEAG